MPDVKHGVIIRRSCNAFNDVVVVEEVTKVMDGVVVRLLVSILERYNSVS